MSRRTHNKQLARARAKKRAGAQPAAPRRRSDRLLGLTAVLVILALIGAAVTASIMSRNDELVIAGTVTDEGTDADDGADGADDDGAGDDDGTAGDDGTGDDGADDGDDATDAADGGEPTAAPSPSCPAPSGAPTPASRIYDEAPRFELEAGATYTATIDTTCGTFVIELDIEGTPRTAENFIALAEDGYYTGTPFHRLIRNAFIQGGDPAGTGCGQASCGADFDADAPTFPGYTIADELTTAEALDDGIREGTVRYPRGGVAMANRGPDTSSSQFFVIAAARYEEFPPSYTLFGHVVDGLDVVEAISQVEVAGDLAVDPVIIRSVTIDAS